eukprot:TRINITY_DN46812_c0_g1_i1.p2 TRINITY_DN46812_c0_g1~~TRINITY_DN46812_c0_g1_i1.p2  ORF type:complete len:149 (-),score=13.08 TRINITY_DN46812_c0_g1_i1:230-676(-)
MVGETAAFVIVCIYILLWRACVGVGNGSSPFRENSVGSDGFYIPPEIGSKEYAFLCGRDSLPVLYESSTAQLDPPAARVDELHAAAAREESRFDELDRSNRAASGSIVRVSGHGSFFFHSLVAQGAFVQSARERRDAVLNTWQTTGRA